ncbi:MAG TPA: hypothetical protein VFT98_21940 [Myxococcota bacterium]|nr:hypothetical protein [Myxococcota bacterium]
MRLSQQLRRLGPALLAAALLLASLASAAHTHLGAGTAESAIASTAPQQATPAASFDLDCALCAAASRLAHGTSLAPARLPDLALARFHAHHAGDVAPPRVDLARREARAPPRLG